MEQKNKLLKELLEEIVLENESLELLKSNIEQVRLGKITPKKLRYMILENRVHIIDKLLRFFPFYLRQVKNEDALNKFVDKTDSDQLLEELDEKKELLQKIAIKVYDIHERLKEDLET